MLLLLLPSMMLLRSNITEPQHHLPISLGGGICREVTSSFTLAEHQLDDEGRIIPQDEDAQLKQCKICMLPPATESHLCAFPRQVAHLFAGVPRSSI